MAAIDGYTQEDEWVQITTVHYRKMQDQIHTLTEANEKLKRQANQRIACQERNQLRAQLEAVKEFPDRWRKQYAFEIETGLCSQSVKDCADELEAAIGEGDDNAE